VTERCVFKLEADGVHLVEVAPGIDVERDILSQMDFRPVLATWLSWTLASIDRVRWDWLRCCSICELTDRLDLRCGTEHAVRELRGNVDPDNGGHRQRATGFRRAMQDHRTEGRPDRQLRRLSLDDALTDVYFDMVAELQAKHYTHGRPGTRPAHIMRMKLGASLPARGAAAHVFETHAEASAFLRRRPHTVVEAGA
jgi:propionate CoA-transferase